jgi:hypothetical protein
LEHPLAWLMTVVAAADMTAYADGLEKRAEAAQSLSAQPAKTPAQRDDDGPEAAAPGA